MRRKRNSSFVSSLVIVVVGLSTPEDPRSMAAVSLSDGSGSGGLRTCVIRRFTLPVEVPPVKLRTKYPLCRATVSTAASANDISRRAASWRASCAASTSFGTATFLAPIATAPCPNVTTAAVAPFPSSVDRLCSKTFGEGNRPLVAVTAVCATEPEVGLVAARVAPVKDRSRVASASSPAASAARAAAEKGCLVVPAPKPAVPDTPPPDRRL